MRNRGRRGAAVALLGLFALACVVAPASAERTQKGNLIAFLRGGLAPLKLSRDRPAPVGIRLEGGLQTADRSLLPRVTRIELGLPKEGVIDTRGLPRCSTRELRFTKPDEAVANCGSAQVGHGRLQAVIALPHQAPFAAGARLRAFNGRVDGRRAVVLHAYLPNPPTTVVLPFLIRPGHGRFGTALVARVGSALGPWARFAGFQMTLSRRFGYRGSRRSYLSASCPIPKSNTAGFFSLAKLGLALADGRRIGLGIARSCRAR